MTMTATPRKAATRKATARRRPTGTETPVDDDVTAKVRVPVRAKRPQDRRPTNAARAEAENTPTTFEWDGEEWTVTPAEAQGLEFLAALDDEEIITAMRLLLGREQAARLFKGRKVDDLQHFFETMGEEVGVGNP